MLESIFEPVLFGLIGFLIYEFVPIPNKFFKIGKYIVIVLLAIAGVVFSSYFGYLIYSFIVTTKTIPWYLVLPAFIFGLIMSLSPFYLSHKAWKNRLK